MSNDDASYCSLGACWAPSSMYHGARVLYLFNPPPSIRGLLSQFTSEKTKAQRV